MKRPILCIASAVLFQLLGQGCSTNPVTGKQQFTLFMPSTAEQKQIGAKYAPQMEKQLGGSIANPQLQNYVNSVGQKVAHASHTPNENFRYEALNDNAVNAFALPGGYIYITKGMLKKLKSEDQLAAIFAHETAHVTAQHSAQAMSQQIGMDVLLQAVSGAVQAPVGVATAAQLGTQIIGLQYSRTHETQADQIGLDYMVKAGYNPQGMEQVMEILQKEDSSGKFDFLSTHPNPKNRLESIDKNIRSKYPNSGGTVGQEDYQKYVLSQIQ